jgi:hypothetical protein
MQTNKFIALPLCQLLKYNAAEIANCREVINYLTYYAGAENYNYDNLLARKEQLKTLKSKYDRLKRLI